MRRISVLLPLCLFAALLLSASAQASGGTVTAWGYNSYGEVGTGEATTTNTCECIPTPVAIPGLSTVSQTDGGYYHSMFLSTDGTVKTSGYNGLGQLGTGNTTENPVPTIIPGLSNVIAIAAGGETSFALLANGTVMAWGRNESGQLGLGSLSGPEECGSFSCSKHPVAVPGVSNVVAISAAGNVAFALLADGTVMGWGESDQGQLGDGVGKAEGSCECIDHPVAIPGVANAIAISASESWGMALLADRSVTSWGENYTGQLGTGDANNLKPGCYCLPASKTLSGVKSIAAGAYHGVAVMLDGSVETWGYNSFGELGNGTHNKTLGCQCDPIPTTIAGFAGAQAASADYYDTLVLLSDGTVKGSGYNGYGELGDETTEERLSPVAAKVSGASTIDQRYYGGSAIVGPSQTLSVALAGTGTGTVQGGGGKITCPTICTAKYPQGRVAVLTATSSAGGFAGFSGLCVGTGTCEAKMESDQTLSATFGVPKGTKITKAKILSPKQKASFSFSAPGAITGYQCLLLKPKSPHKAKASKQPKKPKFSSCKGPKAYRNLKPGKYTFKVRALDTLGADAKPAKRVFRVATMKMKHH